MACVQGKVNWPNAKGLGGTMAEIGQMFATEWVAAIQRGLRKNGENTSVMLPRGGKRTAHKTLPALPHLSILSRSSAFASQTLAPLP